MFPFFAFVQKGNKDGNDKDDLIDSDDDDDDYYDDDGDDPTESDQDEEGQCLTWTIIIYLYKNFLCKF